MPRAGGAQKVETNLVVQQEVFERAYSSLLNGIKHVDKKFMDLLRDANTKSQEQRKNELENLQKSLFAIAMVIQKLKHNIKNEKFVEDHDTEYFKSHLTSIEENLRDFRSLLSEQLQTLQEEEGNLQQSINSLNQYMKEMQTPKSQKQSWPTTAIKARAKSRVNTQLHENVHPDVQEFHQFLQDNGGHTGGWDTKDHLMFTRFLQKYRGLDQMTTALLDFMPDKSAEEIARHESWYHEYLTLKDTQRRALKDWRDEQQSFKKQKKEIVEHESYTNGSATSLQNNVICRRDPSVKEKIQKWKEKQEKLRQQQLEELQEKKKQEEEIWMKKVAYFEQQRKIIAEKRKEQQTLKNKAELVEQNSETHIPKQTTTLKDFWQQDKLYMLRRQSRLQRFSARSHTTNSQSTVTAERDPARLLKPTAVWQAHIKRSLSEDGSKKSSASLYIADVPHLAVPKWREGLV